MARKKAQKLTKEQVRIVNGFINGVLLEDFQLKTDDLRKFVFTNKAYRRFASEVKHFLPFVVKVISFCSYHASIGFVYQNFETGRVHMRVYTYARTYDFDVHDLEGKVW